MAGAPLPGRMRSLLGDFYRDLLTLAPSTATARAWGDRYRMNGAPRDFGHRATALHA